MAFNFATAEQVMRAGATVDIDINFRANKATPGTLLEVRTAKKK